MQAFAVSNLYQQSRAAYDDLGGLADLALSQMPKPLAPTDQQDAETAWEYFARFSDQRTGFAPSSNLQNNLTPWEMGATLLAITSAGQLDLISPANAGARISKCLESLTRLKLCPNRLPANNYCPTTLRMLDQANSPIPHADGWSARAILRLVAGFIVSAHHYPALAPEISIILNRWQLDNLLDQGRFWSGQINDGKIRLFGDCFLGYEQYAARTAMLVNLPAKAALDPRPILRGQNDAGLLLPGDKRLSGQSIPATTFDPFAFEAMEFGWRRDMLDVTLSLYLAQKGRFETTGILTALTEDALDQSPHFAIHSILAGNRPFHSISHNGGDLSEMRCLSTKAAFCWSALLPTPYSQKLRDAVSELATPDGWHTGIYERTGQTNQALSLNTNAAVLEALHFRAHGPLFGAG